MISKKKMTEFLCRLDGPEGCNFRGKGKGLRWLCNGIHGDRPLAKSILLRMKLGKETKEVLKACDKYGGLCDCEILFNAAEHLLKVAK